MNPRLLERAGQLRRGRTPYVVVTVVRTEPPTSARPGDQAIVLPDGSMEGFVGGACAVSTTRVESLRALAAGEPGLLRITPSPVDEQDGAPGVRSVHNPCLSGGALELFLEPVLPPRLVGVLGDGPVARALAEVGAATGHEVVALDRDLPADAAAVVVAAHGQGDEPGVLAAALRAGVPYVALVASRRRAAGVLAEVAAAGVSPDDVARVSAPAGLDIGARTPAEVALSVYAEMVAQDAARPVAPTPPPDERHVRTDRAAAAATAIDPVCGMEVVVGAGVPGPDGTWFCGTGCRDAAASAPTGR